MKSIISRLLLFAACVVAWTSAAAFTVDGLNYSVKDGVATLTGATSKSITSLSVPASVTYGGKTYPVDKIMHNAFDNYTSLRSVRFEDSDTPMHCVIEDNSGFIQFSSPFENCPIEEYYWGRDQAEIYSNSISGDAVFMASSADSVTLTYAGKTTGVTSDVNLFKFMPASKVTHVKLGGNITKFGSNNSFSNCTNLKSVTLLDGTYSLPSGLFPSTGIDTLILTGIHFTKRPYDNIKHLIFGEGWEVIPEKFCDWTYKTSTLVSVQLPSTLKKIESRAFYYCKELTTINFPYGLAEIGDHAFNNCRNIELLTSSAKTPPICDNNAFSSDIYPKAVLTVPMGSRRKYASADVWKNFINIKTEGTLLVSFVIDHVVEDISVEVDFAIDSYTFSAIYDKAFGSVRINGVEGSADVDWGKDAVVEIIPDYGYQIADVMLDGRDVTSDVDAAGRLMVKNVKTDHILTVAFEVKRVRLSIALEGGCLTTIHDFGTEIKYIPQPEEGWRFHSATVGDMVITTLDEDGSFVVGPLTEDITVNVVFSNGVSVSELAAVDNISVAASGRTVFISGAPEEALAEIYDTSGLRYYSGPERSINLDKGGVYIITISGRSYKVRLRKKKGLYLRLRPRRV